MFLPGEYGYKFCGKDCYLWDNLCFLRERDRSQTVRGIIAHWALNPLITGFFIKSCCGCCYLDGSEEQCSAFGYSPTVGCITRPLTRVSRSSFMDGVMAHCPGVPSIDGNGGESELKRFDLLIVHKLSIVRWFNLPDL